MVAASIILLLKNAGRQLEEILQAIFTQDASFEFEVIAVDSGSTDGTLDLLKRFPLRVEQIAPEQFQHGATRNLGASLAQPSAEYLVFLTQDASPADSGWLANLIAPLRADPRAAGAFSRHLPRPGTSPALARQMTTAWQSGGTQRLVKEMPASREAYARDLFYYIFFSNTSSALRRAVWEQYPFAAVDFAEDAVWADQVLRAGYRVIYEPASRVLHAHNYPLLEQFRQNVDHAHAMKVLFAPPAYRQAGFWLRQLRAIPRHAWRDAYFLFHDDFFAGTPALLRLRYLLHSPFWHLASALGTVVGANLEWFPSFVQLACSRQERIRTGKLRAHAG